MSNLNIQQKVSLISQKAKDSKVKEAAQSDEQIRLNEYNEQIKPNLTEEQTNMIQGYINKLKVLGEYKEINIYDMMKKYDWNVKVLDDLTSVMIRRWEEAGGTDGWKEVRRVSKPPVTKKAKEAEDVKRSRRDGGDDDENRNFRGGERSFKEKARRGQSVDPNQGGYNRERGDRGDRYGRYEDYNAGEEDTRYYRDDRTRRRDHAKGQKEIVMYVKKGENESAQQNNETQAQAPRQDDRQAGRKGRFEKVIYVKKGENVEGAESHQETRQGRVGRGRERPQGRREENGEETHHGGWQNEESFEEQPTVQKGKGHEERTRENKPVRGTEKAAGGSQVYQRKENNAVNASGKKENLAQSAPVKGQEENLSPGKHYNQDNLHELFQAKESKEPTKLAGRREIDRVEEVTQPKPKEEKSAPQVQRVEADSTSQTAPKPQLENTTKPQQQNLHDQPIGPNRAHNSQNAHSSVQQTTTAPQNTQNNTTNAQTSHQNTQSGSQSTQNSTASPQGQHNESFETPQAMPQAYGYPQYAQSPYFMPQFPQQSMFNPYMAYMQQAQSQGKEHQGQASYPPGFNPQDMSSMFQVPYILIPQPNGPPIIQPMYQMMPQMMGVPREGEQQKYAQAPYYQFPMNMPSTPAEFYGGEEKKTRHSAYENKQSNVVPNTGPYFNFPNEPKKQANQGYAQQQGGYQFMPFIFPGNPMGGMYPGQQHQGKQNEGSGNSSLKSDFIFPNH